MKSIIDTDRGEPAVERKRKRSWGIEQEEEHRGLGYSRPLRGAISAPSTHSPNSLVLRGGGQGLGKGKGAKGGKSLRPLPPFPPTPPTPPTPRVVCVAGSGNCNTSSEESILGEDRMSDGSLGVLDAPRASSPPIGEYLIERNACLFVQTIRSRTLPHMCCAHCPGSKATQKQEGRIVPLAYATLREGGPLPVLIARRLLSPKGSVCANWGIPCLRASRRCVELTLEAANTVERQERQDSWNDDEDEADEEEEEEEENIAEVVNDDVGALNHPPFNLKGKSLCLPPASKNGFLSHRPHATDRRPGVTTRLAAANKRLAPG